MKELTFNEWQKHIAKELEKNYRKLKLVRDEPRKLVGSIDRKQGSSLCK